ncbi:hypothetical protein [Sphingomonas sp. AX6]|uniref:hypothetical protein n=1 Tax=Sphingomonas sp. AX6 TaxID=2653171 RepID=UPI0012F28768|nr:hypothetical protein [Sphingomonas sp. AX6]VXC65776.1 conserved hypothetical protein [Sphingomonas sp. AX6]
MNAKDERAERLAARLRENLRRRKTQARAVRSGEGEAGTSPDDGSAKERGD